MAVRGQAPGTCGRLWRILCRVWPATLGPWGGMQGASRLPAESDVQVLPPWTLEERTSGAHRPVRGDYFASILGPAFAVTETDWEARSVGTLGEALRNAPGVILQESFGGFEPPRLSIRGSGLDSAPTSRGVALLVDGRPLGRADGSFHSGLFDPLLFSRVEVYRGTLHSALTPAALGGVLQASTTFAPERVPFGTLRVDYGSLGAVRVQGTVVGGEALPFRAAASFQRGHGWREHGRQRRAAVQATTFHNLGEHSRVEVGVYGAAAEYEVPGPLTLGEALFQPRSVSAAVLRDQPRRESDLISASAQWKTASASGKTALGFSWNRFHDRFRQLQTNGETESEGTAFTAHATLARRLRLAAIEHQGLLRATVTRGDEQVDRFLSSGDGRGAKFGTYVPRASTAAISLEDVVWLRRDVALGLGVTALRGRREIKGQGPSESLRSRMDLDDVSGRAAMVWSPRSEAAFQVGVSRGVELPAFDDLVTVQGTPPALSLAGRPLGRQAAVTVEVGTRGTRGVLDWSVTAYTSEWRGEVLRLADSDGSPRGAVNADRTRHEGLESWVRWRVVDGAHRLSLRAISTLSRFTFENDPIYGDHRLAGAPPHVGLAELVYEEESEGGLEAALETTWVGGRVPVDHAGRLDYGGHALGHVRCAWRPAGGKLRVVVAVRNVLDRRYLASTAGVLDLARNPAATSIFLPGPGRTFTLGLEWKP